MAASDSVEYQWGLLLENGVRMSNTFISTILKTVSYLIPYLPDAPRSNETLLLLM